MSSIDLKYIWHKIKNKIINFLEKIEALISWSSLRAIGNQRIVQLTMLIPIIGYYILFSSKFCEYTQTFERINIGIACKDLPSEKTFLLYFGFTCLAFGSFLYSMICPKIIKKYYDPYEYINTEGGFIDKPKLNFLARKLTQRNIDFARPEILSEIRKIKASYERTNYIQSKIHRNEMSLSEAEDPIKGELLHRDSIHLELLNNYKYLFLETFYISSERLYLIARILTGFFYVFGFIVLGSIAFETLTAILKVYLESNYI